MLERFVSIHHPGIRATGGNRYLHHSGSADFHLRPEILHPGPFIIQRDEGMKMCRQAGYNEGVRETWLL